MLTNPSTKLQKSLTLQGNKTLMPAELALQKADTHLCVALARKVRIRLHPSMALRAEIFAEYCYSKGKIALFLNLCSQIILFSIILIIFAHRTLNVRQE